MSRVVKLLSLRILVTLELSQSKSKGLYCSGEINYLRKSSKSSFRQSQFYVTDSTVLSLAVKDHG